MLCNLTIQWIVDYKIFLLLSTNVKFVEIDVYANIKVKPLNLFGWTFVGLKSISHEFHCSSVLCKKWAYIIISFEKKVFMY